MVQIVPTSPIFFECFHLQIQRHRMPMMCFIPSYSWTSSLGNEETGNFFPSDNVAVEMDPIWQGESPHIPLNDLQLHYRHVQLLPWFLDPSDRIMHLNNCVVIQGGWYMSRYAIPMIYECYMRYKPHLTGVDHPTYHWMASNSTPDMLSCHPISQIQQLGPWTSPVL